MKFFTATPAGEKAYQSLEPGVFRREYRTAAPRCLRSLGLPRLRRNYRANNQKRPRNTAVNTERGTLRNFGARSGRPETFGDDYWGIPWHGREICSVGAPVSTAKCGASML